MRAPPGRGVHDETALRVVGASLSEGHQSTSHNPTLGRAQDVSEVAQSPLMDRPQQVTRRSSGSIPVVASCYDVVETAAVEAVDAARDCELGWSTPTVGKSAVSGRATGGDHSRCWTGIRMLPVRLPCGGLRLHHRHRHTGVSLPSTRRSTIYNTVQYIQYTDVWNYIPPLSRTGNNRGAGRKLETDCWRFPAVFMQKDKPVHPSTDRASSMSWILATRPHNWISLQSTSDTETVRSGSTFQHGNTINHWQSKKA